MLSGGIRGVMIITVAAHSLRRFKSSGPSTDQACYGPIATTGLGGSRLPARLNMTNPNLPAPAGAGPSSGEPVSHTSHRGGGSDIKRLQRLHTAISLLEAACALLERATTDGVVKLHPKAYRWCKQIRNEQQALVKEMDSLNPQPARQRIR